MKRFALLVTTFLLAAPMSATAHAPNRETISYRITEAPVFTDGPEGVCLFNGVVNIETLAGDQLGTTTLCVRKIHERFGPPYRFIERGSLTVDLPDGRLEFAVTFTDTYNEDDTAAAHDARGHISGGTGRYVRASGSLRGSGIILFDADGVPQPFLTYIASVKLPRSG